MNLGPLSLVVAYDDVDAGFVDVDARFGDVGLIGKGAGFHLSDANIEGRSIDKLWKSDGMPWGAYGGARATESDVEDAALVVMLKTRLGVVEVVDDAAEVEWAIDWPARPEDVAINFVELRISGEGDDLGAPGPSTTHDEVSEFPVLSDGLFVMVDRHETVVDTAGVA